MLLYVSAVNYSNLQETTGVQDKHSSYTGFKIIINGKTFVHSNVIT